MSTQETTLFDTHAAVKRLTEAGMPVSQAEAVVASQAELSRDLADGLHRQNRFMLTALMGFALLIIAFIEVRLLV